MVTPGFPGLNYQVDFRYSKTPILATHYRVGQKTKLQILVHVFNYWSIFKIISLLHSARNHHRAHYHLNCVATLPCKPRCWQLLSADCAPTTVQKYSSWVLNTYTFIAPKWQFLKKKIANCIVNVLSKVRFTENIEIQPEMRSRGYSMNTLNMYRRRPCGNTWESWKLNIYPILCMKMDKKL